MESDNARVNKKLLGKQGEQIERGDIIQITDEGDGWYPCLLVVDEVKLWGVQAYLSIPNKGDAYYRIENGKFRVVGKAVIISM